MEYLDGENQKMTKLFSKLGQEDIETYQEAAAEACDLHCVICKKTIGFQDWQSFKEDYNRQERGFYFCVRCFRILSHREQKK